MFPKELISHLNLRISAFAHHDPPPRNTLTAKMEEKAMGINMKAGKKSAAARGAISHG